MAGSTKQTVCEIFENMDSGPAASASTSTAQAWLDHHSRSLGLFIDGKFESPADKPSLSLTDSKGGVVCTVACAEDADVSQSALSARNAFKVWSECSGQRRAKDLLRLVGVLGQHGQCVSEMCDLSGAPCSSSVLVRMFQYFSGWTQLSDALLHGWTPLGVVLVVASDDASLYSLMLKVVPALAMGNSVIVVPSRSCVLPSLLLAHLCKEAGLPAGSLNVLAGRDATLAAKVAQNPNVSLVSYCGNKQDAATLCRSTAGMGVPVSVSLCVGATCPFVVFQSADIDSAVEEVLDAAFKKKKKEVQWVLYVQESVLDSVVSRLKLRMSGKKCVALLGEDDRKLLDAAVQEARQQGATLIQCGSAPPAGALYPPTVLCDVAPASPCVVSPPPGPLLPLITFRSNAEAVTLANHSPHGQAASIWTEDLTLALETAKSLSVGCVWVNSHNVLDPCLPTSGHKDSGTSTDGGQECLYQFLRLSSSSAALPRSSPLSVDYGGFGNTAVPAVLPENEDGAPSSLQQFIAGKACKSASGRSVALRGQGGNLLAFYPDGGRKDVRDAVEAAMKVQPGWMKKPPSARAQSLYTLAKILESKRRELASVVFSDSVEDANKEVDLSVERLHIWAAYCDKLQGRSLPMPRSGSALSFPEALGVVGIVLPDDSPLLSMVTLLGAAIAMGNAVVMVPSEKRPLPHLRFIQVLLSSDLPAGLVNVVTGSRDQLTAALANHSVVRAIWYWGSAEGCQFLQHVCSSPTKSLQLFCQSDDSLKDWSRSDAATMEELWRSAVQWKSVWIPTA